MRAFVATVIILAFASLAPGNVLAEGSLRIVSTLSTFADIAKVIGGKEVTVDYICAPRFNPHFVEPRPTDVLKVKRADLLIHGGLGLESWLDPLLNAAGNINLRPSGRGNLDLSGKIAVLEVVVQPITRADGDIHVNGNPHFWLDPRNGVIIASEIANKLSELDPKNAPAFKDAHATFVSKLNDKIGEWRALASPFAGASFVGYHNEWVYLMNFLNFKMQYFLEPKPGIPPTPKQIDFIISKMLTENIRGVVQASFYPLDAAKSVAKRGNSKVLIIPQNVGEIPEASDYISMLDYNIRSLIDAAKS